MADLTTAPAATRATATGLVPAPASAAPALPDPDDRGRTDVRLKVIGRIVEQAVREVRGTTSATTSALGRLTGGELPRADVRVIGRGVHVHAEVGCSWPAPIADVAARVRAAVIAETERQTGLRVKRVDVVVHPLAPSASGSGRVA